MIVPELRDDIGVIRSGEGRGIDPSRTEVTGYWEQGTAETFSLPSYNLSPVTQVIYSTVNIQLLVISFTEIMKRTEDP
jgi:hypothetical protein